MTHQPSTATKPQIETPSQALLNYYFLTSLLAGPLLVIAFPLMWIRFKTLRYELQDSGIRMSVGLLFRKEVIVAYRRIQDIHVSHNVFQRWLGISNVSIQTASGNSMPEIVVEGVQAPDQLRDWLYERMRGAKTGTSERSAHSNEEGNAAADDADNVTRILQGIRDNLAAIVDQASASKSTSSLPSQDRGDS
jgi:uncharacterized membrane protein YdbT with pleckstrin-like domain